MLSLKFLVSQRSFHYLQIVVTSQFFLHFFVGHEFPADTRMGFDDIRW